MISLCCRDGFLNEEEFGCLLQHLFADEDKSYTLDSKQLHSVMKLLDDKQVYIYYKNVLLTKDKYIPCQAYFKT